MNNNIYVIKLWSNVILDENWVNANVMTNLAREVDLLQKAWRKVLIVSSGAIWLWKKNLWQNTIKWLTTIEAGQVFSSIWQATLMDVYISYFAKYNIKVSQALLTRRDFQDRERYNSMKKVMLSSLELRIIPIINENDVLSQEELDFSDNDELSALIAAMIWANNLIILSNIDWLYDKYPWWNLIKEVNKIDESILKMVWKDKSSMWKWWMESKLKIAKMMMDLWIKMYLANWKQKDIIKKISKWENPGTLFESHSEKKVDSLRKWLKAWAVPTWKMQVSTIIADLLRNWKRASLLEIWVEKIEKQFIKWDVVSVCDEHGCCLWYGIAKIDSNQIDKFSEDKKIVIHTDYFINI